MSTIDKSSHNTQGEILVVIMWVYQLLIKAQITTPKTNIGGDHVGLSTIDKGTDHNTRNEIATERVLSTIDKTEDHNTQNEIATERVLSTIDNTHHNTQNENN